MSAESELRTQVRPVAIGGIGGSGTRLVAEILKQLDYYIGDDLNEMNDTVWFTLLFKRTELLGNEAEFSRALDIFLEGMCGRRDVTAEDFAWIFRLAQHDRLQHDAAWLGERAKSLVRTLGQERPLRSCWGWKEPNTHIFLPELAAALPGLHYIHVMRNGLDMAFSDNQNQPRLWGPFFVKTMAPEETPRYFLKYWHLMQERAIRLASSMGARFLLLDLDAFCDEPRTGLERLADFLQIKRDAMPYARLEPLVKPLATRGRFRQFDLTQFDAQDVGYVASLGYETV
jgi:hypothetical protein